MDRRIITITSITFKNYNREEYFNDASRQQVDVIIFEENPITMEYEAPNNLPNLVYGYYLIYSDNRYRIFRLDK